MSFLFDLIRNRNVSGFIFAFSNLKNSDIRDANGNTLLMYAVKYINIEIIHFLLKNGVNVNIKNNQGRTALMINIMNKKAFKKRIDISKDQIINIFNEYQKDTFEWSLILNLIINNFNIDKIVPLLITILLVEYGAQVNIEDNNHETALSYACFTKHYLMIHLLINFDAEVNPDDRSLIKKVVIQGKLEVVEILIQYGVIIDNLPLWYAFQNFNSSLIKLLIIKGADVEKEDVNGNTPLLLACEANDPELLNMILQYDTNINISNYLEYTPLMVTNNLQIAEILVDAGADVNAKNIYDQSCLLIAIQNRNDNLAAFLIKCGAICEDVNDFDILLYSCKYGMFEVVKLLINRGVDINSVSEDQGTALIQTCINDQIKILKFLIFHGANINGEDMNNNTSLIVSCICNKIKIVKILIEYGANVNLVNNRNESALKIALKNNNVQMVIILLKNGAEITEDCMIIEFFNIALDVLLIKNVKFNVYKHYDMDIDFWRQEVCQNLNRIIYTTSLIDLKENDLYYKIYKYLE